MLRSDAITLSRKMAGLEPTVIRNIMRPKWDRYGVEYSACFREPNANSLDSERFRIWDIHTQAPSLVLKPQPLKSELKPKGGEENDHTEVQQAESH